MGQKARYLKHNNDNQPLFENKTSEADLGGSFHIRSPKKLNNNLEKLNLNDNQFLHSAAKAQNVCNLETPSDTFVNFNINNINTVRRLHFKPELPLSTKRSLYSNKENLPEQTKEELKTSESKQFTQNIISASLSSLSVKENKDIVNKASVNIKDDSCNISFETSKYDYDSSLYHTVRETITIPDPSHSSFSIKNADSLIDSSLSTKESECQPLKDQSEHTALDLSSTTKLNSVLSQSPIHSSSVELVPEGDNVLCTSRSLCVKCAHENFITVKGINYSLLNTLGHGGSSIVYEVNIYFISSILYYLFKSFLNIIRFYIQTLIKLWQ